MIIDRKYVEPLPRLAERILVICGRVIIITTIIGAISTWTLDRIDNNRRNKQFKRKERR